MIISGLKDFSSYKVRKRNKIFIAFWEHSAAAIVVENDTGRSDHA